MIVRRHPAAGAPHLPARMVKAAIINTADGMHAHPTRSFLFSPGKPGPLGQACPALRESEAYGSAEIN